MDVIYLDNNATTRPDPAVLEAMNQYYAELWANPNSTHRFGQMARKGVDQAREQMAALVGCGPNELYFTGGGTESVNTAIRGLMVARTPRRRVITSTVEHSATKELVAQLGREGHDVVEIGVDSHGKLDLVHLKDMVDDDTALVSFMWANNETGTIFPMKQIVEICRAKGVPVHTDATQAVGKVAIDLVDTGVDCASCASHKFHGPKGVGALYVRRNLRLRPLLIGGPQERGRRGGTENVPGIVGMGKAAELAKQHLPEMKRVAELRDRLEKTILETIDETRVNGDVENRLPNTSNIGFAGVTAEGILILLSEKGICASAGAACSSGSLEPSHVMKAMNVDHRYAHGAIRFSLSRLTTDAEVDRLLEVLPGVIDKLRKVMPVNA